MQTTLKQLALNQQALCAHYAQALVRVAQSHADLALRQHAESRRRHKQLKIVRRESARLCHALEEAQRQLREQQQQPPPPQQQQVTRPQPTKPARKKQQQQQQQRKAAAVEPLAAAATRHNPHPLEPPYTPSTLRLLIDTARSGDAIDELPVAERILRVPELAQTVRTACSRAAEQLTRANAPVAGKKDGVRFEVRQALRSPRVQAALAEEMWHILVNEKEEPQHEPAQQALHRVNEGIAEEETMGEEDPAAARGEDAAVTAEPLITEAAQ